jgi:hypothetical protein
METDTLKLNRKEVERAMGKAAEMFGTENDWMCELIEIAMLPAVQDWIRRNTSLGVIIKRAGGSEDPSRGRFLDLEEWRGNFYKFPGYELRSATLAGYQYNGVPTSTEESRQMGYSHSPGRVIEGLRREWPEVYWQLVYFFNTVRNPNYTEKNLRIILQEDT